MPEPILAIQTAIPEIGRVLAELLAKQRQPQPAEKIAIRAVWSAVDNTRMYIRKIEDGSAPWPSPNPELVALWSDAAVEIAAMDQELATRLRQKAEYWSDPEKWDESTIEQTGISIDKVASDARALLQLAVPQPSVSQSDSHARDFFISHASEDTSGVARPLTEQLQRRGHTVWLDEHELCVGDDLRSSIDAGLSKCRYGAVVLSRHFFAKTWTQNELAGLLALEAANGRKRLLPIRHGMTQEELAKQSPLIAGRLSVSTDNGISAVADQLSNTLTNRPNKAW